MKYNDLLEVLDSEYANHPEVIVITDTLQDALPKRQKPLAHMHWLEFVLKFGSEGAEGLIGYIQWQVNERRNYLEKELGELYEQCKYEIDQTICHDVFGRNDTCFLPRSSGYNKYYEGVQNAN